MLITYYLYFTVVIIVIIIIKSNNIINILNSCTIEYGIVIFYLGKKCKGEKNKN